MLKTITIVLQKNYMTWNGCETVLSITKVLQDIVFLSNTSVMEKTVTKPITIFFGYVL